MSHRYNGQPSYFRNYNTPNPGYEGWQYTGSNTQARVEYWQKEDVKMDYFPTTGTVKTSMNHPSKGQTQLFRRDLNDDQFYRVAEQPRAHTGHGYYTKDQYKGKK